MKYLKSKKAQLAMEFIAVVGISVLMLITIIIIMSTFAGDHLDRDTFHEIDDLGRSFQQEFLRAAEVSPGYERKLFLPNNVNGRNYSVELEQVDDSRSDIVFSFEGRSLIFPVPKTYGELELGENILIKDEEGLRLE